MAKATDHAPGQEASDSRPRTGLANQTVLDHGPGTLKSRSASKACGKLIAGTDRKDESNAVCFFLTFIAGLGPGLKSTQSFLESLLQCSSLINASTQQSRSSDRAGALVRSSGGNVQHIGVLSLLLILSAALRCANIFRDATH